MTPFSTKPTVSRIVHIWVPGTEEPLAAVVVATKPLTMNAFCPDGTSKIFVNLEESIDGALDRITWSWPARV